jgi:hypothetical protein
LNNQDEGDEANQHEAVDLIDERFQNKLKAEGRVRGMAPLNTR